MKKRSRESIVKRLTIETIRIGKARDALRELQNEIESQVDSCNRGIDLLEEAIDALSEYA